MQWFTTAPPKNRQPFLAKFKTPSEEGYYVFYYEDWYGEYIEYYGNQCWNIEEEDILAWTTFDELDKSFAKN